MADGGEIVSYDLERELPKLIDAFNPTPGEHKLLCVMLNPESRMMPITHICRAAGVSTQVYYSAMNKPMFIEYSRKLAFELIKQETMPLIQTAVAAAKLGSFPHWRALMEMGGLYNGEGKGSAGSSEEQTITIRFADPTKRKDVTPAD